MNPWAELRARADVALRWGHLPAEAGDGLVVDDGQQVTIWLSATAGRRERNAALAHELEHVRRGVPPRDAPDELVAKEEAIVRRITAQRLVPPAELRDFARSRSTVGPVTLHDIAEHFDVPIDIAEQAARLAS